MHRWQIKTAANVVEQGGIIVYPTEAVYGLGCDPLNPRAVERLLALKNRNINKGLLLIAADSVQILQYVLKPDKEKIDALFSTNTTPITWLFEAAPGVPYWLTGHHTTIAIRITRHPIVRQLCIALKHPLISTSANISNRPPVKRKTLAYKHFFKKADLIVGGSLGPFTSPSEIRHARSGKILRSTRK